MSEAARVLRRTAAGQQEVQCPRMPPTATQRRLLLLANGYSPLEVLAAHLPQAQDAPEAAQALLVAGLVEDPGAARLPAGALAVAEHWA